MRGLALFLAIVVLILGCSRTDPVSTDRAGTNVESAIRADATRFPVGFTPLAIGNRWRLHRDWAIKVTGGYPPVEPSTGSDEWEFEQICTEVREGVQYTVERQSWWDDEGGGTSHVRYRQDASGFYLPDLCSCEPPDCGPLMQKTATRGSRRYVQAWEKIAAQLPVEDRASAKTSFDAFCERIERARSLASPTVRQPNQLFEVTILEYPLYPGQSWILRNDPEWFVQATVEALDLLQLPVGRVPAYRIRIDIPGEPDDVSEIYRWWGRCGLMRETMHFEGVALGEDGEPIGTFVWDEIQDVTDINLVDLRPCTIAEE
jgi:hypothetical protein